MTDPDYQYDKTFDPETIERRDHAGASGSLRRDPVYVYDPQTVLLVNVALATRRPILVRGASGTGKSSLARNVASVLGRRYYEKTITSRTQARDLLYEVDLLRRLRDAQAQKPVDSYQPYLQPGPLWWAFDPVSAGWRGEKTTTRGKPPLQDPSERSDPQAVVLLDEIDKADPDVPNNLLIPLGDLKFDIEETGFSVATPEANAPLVFLTTNEERELPPAFLRRCIELQLPKPTPRRLVEIAIAHQSKPNPDPIPKTKIQAIATALFAPEGRTKWAERSGDDDAWKDQEVEASPAELLDTVRACRTLQVEPGSDAWNALVASTVWKFGRTPDTAGRR